MDRPRLWVFAGPNGAGKTTLTQTAFKRLDRSIPVVNPDEIAAQMPGSPSIQRDLLAAKEALKRRAHYLDQRSSFAIETTLTGNGEKKLLGQASERGYKINLVYIGLDDADSSLFRVRTRRQSGGHDVAREHIYRRYNRSLENIGPAAKHADRVVLMDNSGEKHRLIYSQEDGRQKFISSTPPDWARPAIEALSQQTQKPQRDLAEIKQDVLNRHRAQVTKPGRSRGTDIDR